MLSYTLYYICKVLLYSELLLTFPLVAPSLGDLEDHLVTRTLSLTRLWSHKHSLELTKSSPLPGAVTPATFLPVISLLITRGYLLRPCLTTLLSKTVSFLIVLP